LSSETILVENLPAGERLDKALSTHPKVGSRSRAAQLIAQGRVLLKDAVKPLEIKASHRVGEADQYLVTLPPPTPTQIEALDLEIEILYEDEDLLVVEKPSGLVVHPAAGHFSDTLVNALVHKIKDLSMGFAEQRPGIVHRLDKDTSGILVVAKNDFSQAHLVQQFKERRIHRIYYALVFGVPTKPKGRVESFLGRHPQERKKFCSLPQGKLAITHYQTLKVSPQGVSLLLCQLETGRTHQIRIHMSELGHPILGDNLYGGLRRAKGLKSQALRESVLSLNRLALHAAELGFVHPKTGAQLKFTSPWPENMQSLIHTLGLR
jgi:23S rRNA pseudouridine1911/1915/1917 synthase